MAREEQASSDETYIVMRDWIWSWVSRAVWALGAASLAIAVVACGRSEPDPAVDTAPGVAQMADTMTVDHVLRTDERFSTLVAAVDSIALDSTLGSSGPYTVFAPPNSAFSELPGGTVQALLTERTDRLRTVLAQHVVQGEVDLRSLARTKRIRTLTGDSVRVRATDSTLWIGNARVVDAGVRVANGVIHVIDRVLPPPDATAD